MYNINIIKVKEFGRLINMKYIDMVNEGKENFKNLKEEELNISSIELERKIKYALLDIDRKSTRLNSSHS